MCSDKQKRHDDMQISFSSSPHLDKFWKKVKTFPTRSVTMLCNVFGRFRLQAAALWSSSEVRGQTGSTGHAGEKVQGNPPTKKKRNKKQHDSKTFRIDVTFRSQVSNMLDDSHPARDFHGVVKPAIDNLMGHEVTFDILFHNSEHQATLFRYGVKKSAQVSGQSFTSSGVQT